MMAAPRTSPTAQARAAIVRQAHECEKALRLADFVEGESSLSSGIAVGMRKMAALHSEQAFRWAASLTRHGGAR